MFTYTTKQLALKKFKIIDFYYSYNYIILLHIFQLKKIYKYITCQHYLDYQAQVSPHIIDR